MTNWFVDSWTHPLGSKKRNGKRSIPHVAHDRANYSDLEDLRIFFDEEIHLLQSLWRLAREASAAGQKIAAVADLDRVVAEVIALRDRSFIHWEPFTAEDERKARAAMAKGEGFLGLDDAMAQAAGVEKDVRLRRVEEYKRRRGQS